MRDNCIPGGINRVGAQAVGRRYASAFGEDIWNDWKRSRPTATPCENEEAERHGLTPRAA